MSDDLTIVQLLQEAMDSGRAPAEVCAERPDLLPEVQAAWERCRRLAAELDDLFPPPPPSPGANEASGSTSSHPDRPPAGLRRGRRRNAVDPGVRGRGRDRAGRRRRRVPRTPHSSEPRRGTEDAFERRVRRADPASGDRIGTPSYMAPEQAAGRHGDVGCGTGACRAPVPASLLYSCPTREDVVYQDELRELEHAGPGFTLWITLTRHDSTEWSGGVGRIDLTAVRAQLGRFGGVADSFVCGSTGSVEAASALLVQAGQPPDAVRTGRWGPNGGACGVGVKPRR